MRDQSSRPVMTMVMRRVRHHPGMSLQKRLHIPLVETKKTIFNIWKLKKSNVQPVWFSFEWREWTCRSRLPLERDLSSSLPITTVHGQVSSGEHHLLLHSFNMQMSEILFFAVGLPLPLNPTYTLWQIKYSWSLWLRCITVRWYPGLEQSFHLSLFGVCVTGVVAWFLLSVI